MAEVDRNRECFFLVYYVNLPTRTQVLGAHSQGGTIVTEQVSGGCLLGLRGFTG